MDASQVCELVNGATGFARALTVETAAELLSRGRLARLERGAFVTRRSQNQPRLCIVLSGTVRLTAYTEDGREMLTHIVRPGDCWGVHPCLGGYKETNDAVIDAPGTVLILRPDAVDDLMWSRKDFQKAMIQVLCDRLNLTVSLAEQLGAWTARERLAWRLLLLANALVDQNDRPRNAEITVSQETLAAMVHLSRQRTNIILKNLERDGLLALNYGRIEILDFDALRGEMARAV